MDKGYEKLGEELLKGAVTQVGKGVIVAVNSILNRIHPTSRDARTAAMDYWVLFDSRNELLAIHRLLQESTDQLQQAFRSEVAGLSLLIQHRELQSHLCKVSHYLTAFLRADERSRDYHRKKFVQACENYDPEGLLVDLHNTVTKENAKFMNEITYSCDYQSFLQWCDNLSLDAVRAYFCAMQLLCVRINNNEVQPFILDDESAMMLHKISEILSAIRAAGSLYRSRILAEIGKRIDNFMIACKSTKRTDNQSLAVQLGDNLGKMYPWYAWAVIIAEDNPKARNFLSYSDDFGDNLLIQESIHEQFLPFGARTALKPIHRRIMQGEDYGIFTCRRKFYAAGKLAHRRRLTVFWAKQEQTETVFPDNADAEFLNGVNARKLAADFKVQQIKERRLCRTEQHVFIEDVLLKNGCQYIAYLGMSKKREAMDIGIYFARRDTEVRSTSWPHYVENEHGHVFLWITNVTPKAIERKQKSAEMEIARKLVQFRCRSALSLDASEASTPLRELWRNNSGARTSFNRSENSVDENNGRWLELVAEHTNNGNQLFVKGDIDSAFMNYERVKYILEDNPNMNPPEQRMIFLTLNNCNLALCQLLLNDAHNARNSADCVLQFDPDNLTALMRRSLANVSLENYTEAGQDLQRLTRLQPERSDIGILLRVVELATLAFSGPRTPREVDPRKASDFWSLLPEFIQNVSDSVAAEPERKDATQLLSELKALNELTKDVLHTLQSEQAAADSKLYFAWLNIVLQVTNDLIRLKSAWLFMEREYVQMATSMVRLAVDARRAFLPEHVS